MWKLNLINDPWDCKPWFKVDSLDDPAEFERHIQWYIDVSRRRSALPEAQIQATAANYRASPALFRAKTKELLEVMGATIGDQYRVYCLGTNPGSELMWAHYARSHQCLCLEFSTRNAVFASALQVAYAKTYPLFDVTASDEEHSLLPLIAKSAAWSYEEEYRLISQEKAEAIGDETLISDKGVTPIPADALTSIIVGCLATDETIASVRSIIAAGRKPLSLQRAIRSPNRYELTFETLS